MARRPKTKKRTSKQKNYATRQALAPPRVLAEQPLRGAVAGALADAPRPKGAKSANTIIFVHGIGNKPQPSVLKCQWDSALAETELGDRSRMAYWVNRAFYPEPIDQTCADTDLVTSQIDEGLSLAARYVDTTSGHGQPVEREVKRITSDPARQAFLLRIAQKMQRADAISADRLAPRNVRQKILPLPAFLRRWITQGLTELLLRDVHDFFFVHERRKIMEDSLMGRLAGGGGPFVVLGHSLGSIIAYNVLRRLDPAQFQVPLFVTIGSPLGLDEVQDLLRQWTGGNLPFPSCVGRWVNVADRLDPVALDGDISNDFEGHIENYSGLINPDSPRHPHSATGYLSTSYVREPVRETMGVAFMQRLAPFAIAKDLVASLEDEPATERHEVLIQLAGENVDIDLDTVASGVQAQISRMVRAAGLSDDDAEFDRLRHFVSAKLTRQELEALRSQFSSLKIQGIWRDSAKRALIVDSTNTIQARPANLGYGADGRKTCWAIMDTGIRADHPHFAKFSNIVEQWDCTHRGPPRKLSTVESATLDDNGHGTHVAAIVAGTSAPIAFGQEQMTYDGMAPRCELIGMKVLDKGGNGKDSWIIKAMDLVAGMNERAGKLVIHGVNLSLGGSFDPSAYGCGHTPLCQEIRRLWQQGVLVCLAAGNEGYTVLAGVDGEIPTNMDLSIGDPANLEEAIAVGSVHKTNPNTYGISYFSSRGPTADGRRKPDVVAPGEKILSARHDWQAFTGNAPPKVEDLYLAMSGTSMAAPHVSGLLAAFLSLRREFIGYPDRVKSILLGSCIDLRRDPYMQGAGLPNLIKMLALN